MTEKQFFSELAKVKKGFVCNSFGKIRKGLFCPITSVCLEITGQSFHAYQFCDAAEAMGLDMKLACEVAASADYKYEKKRKKVLKALGLKDE